MKKGLLFVFVFVCSTYFFGSAQDVFTFNQSQAGIYELKVKPGAFKITETNYDGTTFSELKASSNVSLKKKGYADLPYWGTALKISPDKNVSLKVEVLAYEDIRLNFPILPSRGVIYRDQDPSSIPYLTDSESLTNDFYPADIARITDPFIVRDVRGVSVFVHPFRYNAYEQILRVYTELKIELIEDESTVINPLLGSSNIVEKEMEAIYESVFINYENNRDDLTIGQYGEILVITTARDEEAIAPYIEWKRSKGFVVHKEVVEQGTLVKDLIQAAYNENDAILYVQLVGDWDDIKSETLGYGSPMDPQLGCVVGTDEYPDITVGRFSASSPDDVSVQVNKVITYEKEPDAEGVWYKTATGIASSQGPGDDNEMDYEHEDIIYNDKLSNLTYTNFNAIYDPQASVSMVNDALAAGTSVINYTGHGSPTSWGSSGFSNSNVQNLTNGSMMPFIVSVACNNGDFHNGECFAEAWTKHEGGGAIMFLGATISQPWDPPMRGQDYFMDILCGGYNYDDHPNQSGINTNEQRTTLGSIIFNGLVLVTTESGGGDDWETAKTWTIFGDASLQVRTDTPAELSCSSDYALVGVPFTATITANGAVVEGAMVTISANDIYYTAISDASGNVSIEHELMPGTATLVVTAFNTTTIATEIDIIPPDGPWIVMDAFSFDDASGNANGMPDYGETLGIDMTAKNVGSEPAESVSAEISTEDAFVTINSDSYEIGNIEAGSSMEIPYAFEISLADDVPDMHTVTINLDFTDGNRTIWNSNMSFQAYAPYFEAGTVMIDDSESGNNNGILDAGETADLMVYTFNKGHADAASVTASIGTSDPLITINTTEVNWEMMGAGDEKIAAFNVTAADDVPVGTPVSITYEVNKGAYNCTKEIIVVIGEIPEYNMQNGVETLCSALFFDTGGESGEYSENEDLTMTFIPATPGARIKAVFSEFDVESGWDYLYVHDGMDASATQVAGSPFSGTTLPDDIIADNGDGALTFHFTSDYYIVGEGWKVDISCHLYTGLEEERADYILVYPNPSTAKLFVENVKSAVVELYNINGRLVYRAVSGDASHEINTSSLASGHYLLRVQTNENSIIRKVLIQ